MHIVITISPSQCMLYSKALFLFLLLLQNSPDYNLSGALYSFFSEF
uniref:Uncharacterized protein n=1 Tax=Setaria italica TaxID=4555 RepID=K3Z1M9_SETIT